VLPALADAVAALVDRATVDVVTWVPTSAARRRERGFDQARLLARAVARRLRLPCRALLVRAPGPPQTGRSARARMEGPAFSATGHAPRRVLVIDDVITTGATVVAAAGALRAGGAIEVKAVAAARTPLKRRTGLSDAAGDD
jgi:predicted amidophosphoribosyltransferase